MTAIDFRQTSDKNTTALQEYLLTSGKNSFSNNTNAQLGSKLSKLKENGKHIHKHAHIHAHKQTNT
jgi:hypothetical protein